MYIERTDIIWTIAYYSRTRSTSTTYIFYVFAITICRCTQCYYGVNGNIIMDGSDFTSTIFDLCLKS